MPDDLTPTVDHDALLARLVSLSRKYELHFRIEVGRTLAETFYDGDIAAYRSQDPKKPGSFRRFVAERAEALLDHGFSERLLRDSLLAWHVAHLLPQAVVDHLGISHLVELGAIEDDQTCKLLAQASVDNGWSVRRLIDAIQATRRGQWIDAEPAVPGLQPPEPAAPAEKPLAPGRVITRIEKSVDDLDALAAQWESVDVAALSKAQRERAAAALAQVEARVKKMRERVLSGV